MQRLYFDVPRINSFRAIITICCYQSSYRAKYNIPPARVIYMRISLSKVTCSTYDSFVFKSSGIIYKETSVCVLQLLKRKSTKLRGRWMYLRGEDDKPDERKYVRLLRECVPL